jgi:predicted Rossmann fold flavoprotein
MTYHTIIIGGGPAGLMAANVLEKHNINYVLLEKNEKCGKKLLLTGGRRCNVTNHLSIRDFIDTLTFKHKRFLYSALTKFSGQDVIHFFDLHGLRLVLENNFKYFPETEKSLSVLEALIKDIKPNHIMYQQGVKELHQEDGQFKVVTKTDVFYAKHVVVATGSNSFPSTGSSGDGLVFAKHLQINYKPFTPAETHVYSNQIKTSYKALQGVSLSQRVVTLKQQKISYQGDLLFTHFGLSGPVIMHLSEFIYDDIMANGTSILSFSFVDKSKDEILNDMLLDGSQYIHKKLESFTTKKIIDIIFETLNLEKKKIAETKKQDLNRILNMLTQFEVIIDKVEDKEKAYVNKGGIDTKALDPKSMEVKAIKHLYFIGEVTDLHGPIGGYNITIALSTGHLAASHITTKL